jgi:signal transduction histidine kinase
VSVSAPAPLSSPTGALTTPGYHLVQDRPRDVAADRSLRRRLAHMSVVCVAYYVGAMIGFLFQAPSVPQSVLWTPNSILFATLLVSRRDEWPLLLISALPAHLLVGWHNHAPLLTMTLLYLTNAADAAVGATILRYVSRGAWHPTGLRALIIFLLLGAPISPFLFSFADAAITVGMRWSSDYWLAFFTRVRANVLTNVIFVPAAVALVEEIRAPRYRLLTTRFGESVLMFVGLAISAEFVFSRPGDSASLAAMLYAPLTFLIWAAVRFGPGMASGSMLLLAYIATWNAMRGLGVFSLHSHQQFVPALQLFLLGTAVPILFLAAAVQDRKRVADDLRASQRALERSVEQSRALSGRMLSAVESERSRIARELHDDVNQRLAAVAIVLSGVRQRLPDEKSLRDDASWRRQLREDVFWLQHQTTALVDGVRSLSHDLHPSLLQHAGLATALRSLCTQFDATHDIAMSVRTVGEGVRVPADVALCVYRVAQEALHNVAKHSGAHSVHVALAANEKEVELVVIDDGRGFDAPAVSHRGGLGLTSMDERVRVARGNLHLETSPGHGTRVHVRVPNGESHETPERPARG